jgi:alkyldihydroxyacetonephosphate synthase
MPKDPLKPIDPALRESLAGIFPPDRLSASAPDRIAYARDLWPVGQFWARQGAFPHPPDVIVWPEKVDEIVALLQLANERRFPVIPMGAGSGVCGGTVAHRGGVILDMKRMKQVRRLDGDSLLATIEAGIIGQHLEEWLNGRGYTLGHFPSSIYCSSFGGWIATRSAGQLSTKYGKIEDMVQGLEGVFPDGTLFSSKVVPRSAAGPRFDQLLLGSEGTLAVITAATCRIRPLPEARRFAGYVYPDHLHDHDGARPRCLRVPARSRLRGSEGGDRSEGGSCRFDLPRGGRP